MKYFTPKNFMKFYITKKNTATATTTTAAKIIDILKYLFNCSIFSWVTPMLGWVLKSKRYGIVGAELYTVHMPFL